MEVCAERESMDSIPCDGRLSMSVREVNGACFCSMSNILCKFGTMQNRLRGVIQFGVLHSRIQLLIQQGSRDLVEGRVDERACVPVSSIRKMCEDGMENVQREVREAHVGRARQRRRE